MELLLKLFSCSSIAPNITAFLLRILEDTVSNLASETGHILTHVICDFAQSFQVYGVRIAQSL